MSILEKKTCVKKIERKGVFTQNIKIFIMLEKLFYRKAETEWKKLT